VKLWGRDPALAVLADAVDEAVAGRGRLVLLCGEAGIGKTAVAAEMLRTAADRGLFTTWATCREGMGSPPYWPWVQTLRTISSRPEATDLGELLGLAPVVGMHPAQPGPDADSARFALFDRLAHALAEAGRRTPTVVILDDLHWSDEPSLLALDFVAQQVRTAPLLLVGTYRESEGGDTLLRLASGAHVVELSGLDAREITGLLADVTGQPPDEGLAREVRRRTNGNPFFAREVARLLAATPDDPPSAGTLTDVPIGVRAVLDARLVAVSPQCLAALRMAAVAGGDVDVAVLSDALGWSTRDVTAALEEGVRQRVLVRSSAGDFRFVHDLFLETAYDGLSPAEVAAHHLAVARSLERSRRRGAPIAVAALARQFAAAASGADASDDIVRSAVAYAKEAAADAVARLADEDACDHYERALRFATDGPTRLDLLLGLGHAQYRSGRADNARATFATAADLARDEKDPEGLARAAIGWHRIGVRSGTTDEQGVQLLEEALALVSDDRGPWASLLLAALARNLHQQLQFADASVSASSDATHAPVPIARRAVELARAHGDPAVLATCLLALHDAYWCPGSARERLPIVAEMATLAAESGDHELYAQARQLRAAMLLEIGDPDGISELAEYCRLAEALGHQRARWAAMTRRATIATLVGDLAEATRLAEEALAFGLRIGEPDAIAVTGTTNFVLHRLGGRTVAMVGDPSEIAALGPTNEPGLRALSALLAGDRDGATHAMAALPMTEFPPAHDVEIRVFAAWIAAAVGTPEQRSYIYNSLLPYSGIGSVVGGCAAFQGAVDHHLATLDVAMGKPAAPHLQAALELYERLGAAAWAALARRELAELGHDESSAPPVDENVFRRDGAVWKLRFAGRETHVPDAKGLRDIATLLGLPGREIHVRALLGLAGPATGADDVLDAKAAADYRLRIAELDEELDAADASGDAYRGARATAERDFLIRELAAATGLGGRPRRLADETEKARKTVTARIRHSVTRLADVHPELAEHLAASVQTGTQCVYLPAEPVRWRL
jgi:tetratricopeptide (TPR) repeat protein